MRAIGEIKLENQGNKHRITLLTSASATLHIPNAFLTWLTDQEKKR